MRGNACWRTVSAWAVAIVAVLAGPAHAGELSGTDVSSAPKGLTASDWSSIRAAYEAHRHAVVADEATPGHFRARNPGQRWITRFDGRGFSTTPEGAGWSWGLDLVSYGRGEAQRTIDGVARVQAAGGRVEYAWDDSLTEWYINDQRGFEHGYTLRDRPDGVSGREGMLHFTLAVRGELLPSVSENGRDVAFTSAAEGAIALTYNNLKVFDADGVHLAASFRATTTASGTSALLLTIDDTNARYPLTIDPTAQRAYLKVSGTRVADAEDRFGMSVAVSGDTVVVGAPEEDSNATGVDGNQADNSALESGAAYVFVRSPGGTTWSHQAYLKASNTGAIDRFGYSVAVSGDTVVVGAYGESSSATGVDGNQADDSLTFAGAAYVFVRSPGGTWSQQAYLKASNTGAIDGFGWSVAVSGDTVVVGAQSEDSNATGVNGNQASNSAPDSGAAYVFVRSPGGTTWSQQAYLKASNTGRDDRFGRAVAVSGDTVVVGAENESSNATGVNGNQADNSAISSGAAYVFVRSPGGTDWSQQAYLKASNTGMSDQFGVSVAVSGDTIVVGAHSEDSSATGIDGDQANNSGDDSGAAYVFVRPAGGTTWTQQAYLKASNTGISDYFGISVAVAGDTVVVGALGEDSSATGVDGNQGDDSAAGSGAAYVFVRPSGGTTWTQQAYVKASNTGLFDQFGMSVAVSGGTVVVGAIGEDSNATGVNGNPADDSASESGAAYVFVRPVGGTAWTQQAYAKGSGAGFADAGDQFGFSVSVSGDTVVVGAPCEDSGATGVNGNPADNSASNSGAAYVFVRSPGGTTWTQQAYLKASNTGGALPGTTLGDLFGVSVAVSGDTIVVGAWGEYSNATGVDGDQSNNDLIYAGAAYVFVRPPGGTTWTQQAYLKASNTGPDDLFGVSVAISGDTIVVGALGEYSNATGVNGDQSNNDAAYAGAAYVFVRPPGGTTWTQEAYLKASNTEASEQFGRSVAISGDTIVVGAIGEDSNATGIDGDQSNNSAELSGAAYVFVRPPGGTTWSQQAYLKASNTGAGDFFGWCVAVSGDTVVVGASLEESSATGVNGDQADNSAGDSGAAYVFVRSPGGTSWTQQAYLKASNTGAGDVFGYSVAVSGDTILVGAQGEASSATGVGGNQVDNSAGGSGAAYVFVRPSGSTSWTQWAYLKASNTGTSDFFGTSVAVSGDTVVVGAYTEDSNATGVNGDQANDFAIDSGAAYVFALTQPLPTPSSPLASPANICAGASSVLSVADPEPGIVIDWFAGSCGGAFIGTGNSFVVTPVSSTAYFARARRTSDGNTSAACASVSVTVSCVGACCAGSICVLIEQAQCDGRFVGVGAACNAPGNTTTPCCRADFTQDGVRGPTDIFAFLSAYFSTAPSAVAFTDFDGNGTRQPQDIFAFLNAYFAGGC